ncbi:unnamed protein product [Thelazia callipaeda]|uniref:7-dehydrocholesterol reductase n=1 Tax=Thelazia callipaeda TaxID=103827 RepID=A0A0N5CKL4_THECL|nr:unnamed protein product [Thelazia callipaeda]
MLRSSRRTSLVSSQHSLPSRRSSSNLKDIERIQIAAAQVSMLLTLTASKEWKSNISRVTYKFFQTLWSGSNVFQRIFPSPFSSAAWKIIIFITLLQLVFYLVLPGDNKTVLNSMGEREKRSVNSFYSCLLVILLFILGSALGFYKASIIYLNWIETLLLLNLISMVIILSLFLRQRHRDEDTYNLLACAILQLIYIAKTHWYEHLRYSQLDAQNQRAGGFFCIWGALVLFPSFYATPITVLAQRKVLLPLHISAILLFIGTITVYVTADIDQLRVQFRLANGNMKVWGEDPFFITAKYRRKNGDIAANLLLGSGWWGLCRHPNYFCEWLTFASWTMLQQPNTIFTCSPLIFLTCYLYYRLKHDELRCLAKYGPYWLQYRNHVKYLIIPTIY